MAGEPLDFVYRLKKLENVGDTFLILNSDYDKAFGKMQVARALSYHGKRQGRKYSYVQTENGYLVAYTGNR